MSAVNAALATLEERHPEWTPWLRVLAEAAALTEDSTWDAAVPDPAPQDSGSHPLLGHVAVTVDLAAVRRASARLLGAAAASGSPLLAALVDAVDHRTDMTALFAASLVGDDEYFAALAGADPGADAARLQSVLTLVCRPFLQACNRRHGADAARQWRASYCPICAAWPCFVEVRGIERDRHARCGRCGAAWRARMLHCPYCETSDHEQLVTLVPQDAAASWSVDACRRCQRYTKTVTTLQGCRPEQVFVDDLASADIDLAALDLGYTRPSGLGFALAITVTDVPKQQRLTVSHS
jgi:FdhE protein